MSGAGYAIAPRVRPDDLVALGAEARSYADLWLHARAVAARLPAPLEHAPFRSEVLLACADRYHFTVGLLASWLSGHAVALAPSHRSAVLSEIAAGERVLAQLHDGELAAGVDVRECAPASARDDPAPPPVQPAHVHLATLYTSGSTGSHKPSPKRANELLGEVDLLYRAFGAGLTRVLCTVPPRHIYGLLFGVLLPLRAGACLLRETPLHADAVRESLTRHGVDALVAVPAHLEALSTGDPGALAGLRHVFSSGARLPEATFTRLSRVPGLTVHEVLGSTETGGIGHRTSPDAPFSPFPGVEVGADREGRLLLRSPHLPADLAQPHLCDDRVELLDDGRFRHLGRTGDVVKVGGTRISMGELELRARGLEGVQDAAALTRDLPGLRGRELLLVAVAPGWDAARMRAALGAWFDPIALPRRFRFVEALPREPTGKLQRDALLSLFETDAAPPDSGHFERELRERTSTKTVVRVRPPRDLIYFRGHFAGAPVLPGVAQLGRLAVVEAARAWPDLPGLRRVRHLKFRRPIAPEEELELELLRPAPARVDFTITHGGVLCTSGTLLFGEAVDREGSASR